MPPVSHTPDRPAPSGSPDGITVRPKPDTPCHAGQTCSRCGHAVPDRRACECGNTTPCPAAPSPNRPEPDDYDDYDHDEDDYDDEDDDGDGLIHDYWHKPWPVFHGQGPLFLGLELEVATPTEDRWYCARTAAGWLRDLGYLKSDSSIDYGFEIVTHPMSYRWAIECFPWPMLSALADLGCEATSQTGLHVHLSRAGFTGPAHAYRWMKFVYRNQSAVTALARRESCQWAQFSDEPRRAVKEHAKGVLGSSRFWAINTSNTDTFELRVFASSLHPLQVQAALGFAAASVEYTRDLTVAGIVRGGWSWPAFTGWLAGRPGYAALRREVEALTCAC